MTYIYGLVTFLVLLSSTMVMTQDTYCDNYPYVLTGICLPRGTSFSSFRRFSGYRSLSECPLGDLMWSGEITVTADDIYLWDTNSMTGVPLTDILVPVSGLFPNVDVTIYDENDTPQGSARIGVVGDSVSQSLSLDVPGKDTGYYYATAQLLIHDAATPTTSAPCNYEVVSARQEIEVTPPLEVSLKGAENGTQGCGCCVWVNVKGGTPPYVMNWRVNGVEGARNFTPTEICEPGDYVLTISDRRNCQGQAHAVVGDPNDCERAPPPPPCEVCPEDRMGRPDAVAFYYSPGRCAGPFAQDDVICDDWLESNLVDAAMIRVYCGGMGMGMGSSGSAGKGTGKGGKGKRGALQDFIFEGVVNAGEKFSFSPECNDLAFEIIGDNSYPAQEVVGLHVSCSQPLSDGDTYGSIVVTCPDGPIQPPCTMCDGKPENYWIAYTGAKCDPSNPDQDGKASCQDYFDLPDDATEVTLTFSSQKCKKRTAMGMGDEKSSGNNGMGGGCNPWSITVSLGDTFVYPKTDNDIIVDVSTTSGVGQTVQLHVSCSKDLSAGDQFGSLMFLCSNVPSCDGVNCYSPL